MPACGLDIKCDAGVLPDLSHVWRQRHESNAALLARLFEDVNATALHKIALSDAELGRMTAPCRVSDMDLSELRLVPRFAVVQGVLADGSPKIRAVDHFSWSVVTSPSVKRKRTRKEMKDDSVNGHTGMQERVRHDHLDDLARAMRECWHAFGEAPGVWKADVDAAFRRIPVRPIHRWAAGVAYVADGDVWVSRHCGMPFGATASVFAWHRVGALICAIARSLFKMPVFRYVDDFFAAERSATAEHSMQVFARLTRLLLGQSAIADRKLEFGAQLPVLGMLVQPCSEGVRFTLCREKSTKWISEIDDALSIGRLECGAADKLAGRLMWSTQHLFHRCSLCAQLGSHVFCVCLYVLRFGRAMIKAVYAQKFSRSGAISSRLRAALVWWKAVLANSCAETYPWVEDNSSPARLFVDAASTPPRCAAVLFVDGAFKYTDVRPPSWWFDGLQARSDNQIMTLVCLFRGAPFGTVFLVSYRK